MHSSHTPAIRFHGNRAASQSARAVLKDTRHDALAAPHVPGVTGRHPLPEAAVRVLPRSGASAVCTGALAGLVSSRGRGCAEEGGRGVADPTPGAVTTAAVVCAPPEGGIASRWPARTLIVSGRPFARARSWTDTP